MDNSLSESARFAVYREKLKGICEANNLSYVFIKNAYPIKLVIRPLGGVGEQMSMLEEVEDDEEDEPTSDELTQATEIARQNNGITQAMLEEKMGVNAEKAIALLDDMESAGVIEFSNGHYTIAAADSEEE